LLRQPLSIKKSYAGAIHFYIFRLFESHTRNPKLKRELVECQLQGKSPFPLSAHIVLPFQRLLKYHLMLGRTNS
jgi:hypothetical protein